MASRGHEEAPKAIVEIIHRAVARAAVASLLETLESSAEVSAGPAAQQALRLLSRAAGMMKGG